LADKSALVSPADSDTENVQYLPVQLDYLRLEHAAPMDLYIQPAPGQPFVLYCEKNLQFTNSARLSLIKNNITQLYIPKQHFREYQRYLNEHLLDILRDNILPVQEKASILYSAAQGVAQDILEQPGKRDTVQVGKKMAGMTVGFLKRSDFVLEHFLHVISDDYYLFTHSINVVGYSVLLAIQAGYKDDALLREIANGALLHDIGKTQLPRELMTRKGSLRKEEWLIMQQYPRLGYELMHKHDCLGEIALDIILHHQEKLQGQGYPDKITGDTISPYVRIVTIADIFDALTTDRPYQRGVSTFEALRTMRETLHGEIDMTLFRHLISLLGKSPR